MFAVTVSDSTQVAEARRRASSAAATASGFNEEHAPPFVTPIDEDVHGGFGPSKLCEDAQRERRRRRRIGGRGGDALVVDEDLHGRSRRGILHDDRLRRGGTCANRDQQSSYPSRQSSVPHESSRERSV